MIVICKKPTKKLVKGLRYEVHNLYNDGRNQRWLESKVEIKGLGRYSVENFTDVDGKPLPKINIIRPREVLRTLEFSDLKEGDILVCTSETYKTLVKGAMYRIEKLTDKVTTHKNYAGNTYNSSYKTVKFVGIKRALKFSSWRFRKLSASENREISLNTLLTGERAKILTSRVRKIDFVTNKNLELMNIISKSLLDGSRHQLSIVDWAIQKTGTNFDVNSDDFKPLLSMTLADILQSIEK